MPAKRERMKPGSSGRYARRNSKGQFKEAEDVDRSAAGNQKRESKTKAKRGKGNRGDR